VEDLLARLFETHREHLRRVALRMLGSTGEADDAVQEAWLRLSRADAEAVDNLGGWLTTVVSRVCLDMLRARATKKEVPPSATAETLSQTSPEDEALLADSVGLALLVVLDTLAPAERLAFVLHDLFAVPFDEIGLMVGRSAEAARQLASRARRRVQGADAGSGGADLIRRRETVEAFLSALRTGDFDGVVAVLDPDLVVHIDGASAAAGRPVEVHGAANWAKGAVTFANAARLSRAVLVNGEVGLVWAPLGRLIRVLRLTMKDGKITHIHIIGDPVVLRELDLAVPPS